MSWVHTTTATPRARSSARAAPSSSWPATSRPAVGSSRMSTSAPHARDWAIRTRWRSPPREPPERRVGQVRDTHPLHALGQIRRRPARRRPSRPRAGNRPIATTSDARTGRTKPEGCDLAEVGDPRRARARAPRRAPRRIPPAGGSRPTSVLMSVDLPEPLVPRTARVAPGATSSVMSSTTGRPS